MEMRAPAQPIIRRLIVGMLALLVVGVAALQIAMLRSAPVSHGSTSWTFDAAKKCKPLSATDPTTVRCSEVAFAPGAAVGIGFSVRNDGPLPMTIVSVADLGAESAITLAELHPVVSPAGVMPTIDGSRPFTSIDLAPGEQATIYLLGRMRACDAVRGYWGAGGGLQFDYARITARWLLLSTEVKVPLRDVLQIDSPADGQCP
jgi:hypothetical protein